MTPELLPTVNALLNTSAAVSLVLGYRFIRRRNVRAHRACMLTAVALSAAFLVTYTVHHAEVGSVPFRGTGPVRALYFALLVPHVLLAAALVPLAGVTLVRALSGRFDSHRALARRTLPIWLFVSVSGVVVYMMLYRLDF